MAQKTIPQLTEITSIDENALIPVDTGIQSYKITTKNLATSLSLLQSGAYKAWSSTQQYLKGEFVYQVISNYPRLFRAKVDNIGSSPALGTNWTSWDTYAGGNISSGSLWSSNSNNSLSYNSTTFEMTMTFGEYVDPDGFYSYILIPFAPGTYRINIANPSTSLSVISIFDSTNNNSVISHSNASSRQTTNRNISFPNGGYIRFGAQGVLSTATVYLKIVKLLPAVSNFMSVSAKKPIEATYSHLYDFGGNTGSSQTRQGTASFNSTGDYLMRTFGNSYTSTTASASMVFSKKGATSNLSVPSAPAKTSLSATESDLLNQGWSPINKAYNVDFFAISLNTSPYLAVYKRSGDTLTALTVAGTGLSSQQNISWYSVQFDKRSSSSTFYHPVLRVGSLYGTINEAGTTITLTNSSQLGSSSTISTFWYFKPSITVTTVSGLSVLNGSFNIDNVQTTITTFLPYTSGWSNNSGVNVGDGFQGQYITQVFNDMSFCSASSSSVLSSSDVDLATWTGETYYMNGMFKYAQHLPEDRSLTFDHFDSTNKASPTV